jgi:hypothetical protein
MPIPGHPTKTSYRTIALEDFGVTMCGSQTECAGSKRAQGWRAHWYGRVDRSGTIHWRQADKRATKRGMRNLMKLLALVFHREWWTEPRWRKLYLVNIWAYREIEKRYHYLVWAKWSYTDRLQSFEWARTANKRRSIRRADRNVYAWWLRAGVQSSSREDAQ